VFYVYSTGCYVVATIYFVLDERGGNVTIMLVSGQC